MTDEPPDKIGPRAQFADATRERLKNRFVTEWLRVHPHDGDDIAAEEARIFLCCLEDIAATFPLQRKYVEIEPQQRRRERMEALANALDNLIEVVGGMDDAALGFAVYRGLGEMAAEQKIEHPEWRAIQDQWAGNRGLWPARVMKDAKPQFAAFALGVRRAIPALEMPAHAKRSPEESLAVFIEDQLGGMRLPCTTSDTGLAGLAFLETLALADGDAALNATAKNWLQKAVKSKASWRQFVGNISARNPS